MKFAIMGHGVVGSGTAQLFLRNKQRIEVSCGEPMELKYILDIKEFPDLEYADLFINDFSVIENDPEIDVVVETIGGAGAALEYVSRCLAAGKSVVTSNKELISTHGTELMLIAERTGAVLKFEASVGGGIPVLKPLHQCLAANEFVSVTGILNGTTNFILTKMENDNMGFDDALALAKKLGYAELNPSADIDGHDVARKISILGGIAFGIHIHPDHIPTVGIRGVTLDDIRLARSCGGAIKLIARTALSGDSLCSSVCPTLVADTNQLSTVNDVFNGIIIDGDATGNVMFYGKGAGKFPTASAVISDITDCIREKGNLRRISWRDCDHASPDTATRRYYLRYASSLSAQALSGCTVLKADCGSTGYITAPLTLQQLDEMLAGLPNPDALMPVLE